MANIKIGITQMITCPCCDQQISPHAKRCSGCMTVFATGSLNGLRVPRHASLTRIPCDWVKRFLGV
jgi:hypothetical protein